MKPSRPAQQRLLAMTEAMKHCEAQAKAYGQCVSETKNPTLNECVREFEALGACMKQSLRKIKK